MTIFERNLDQYAELAVKVGVNIQPGQVLRINAAISSADFVRKVAKKAYDAGAKDVYVDWSDDELTRMKYDLAPEEAFSTFPQWKAQSLEELVENGGAVLSVISSNPDLLKGVDPTRIAAMQKVSGQAMKNFRKAIQSDKISWSIVAVPSKDWAAKVFPNLPEHEQESKLWDAIFKSVRVDVDNPVQAWKEHDASLHKKSDYLNAKKYKKLHYKASGTDLTIELPEKHIWVAASSINENGHEFMANMPTEEVFTVPHKTGVNGYVSSTKPLSYGGNLIENFTLTFKDGKIVDVKAEKGYETLKNLVETDEGSHYLGEVALVPHNSPISNSNVIFYNTLFDENASNHLAIGSAYAFCLEGGKTMSKEELASNGANDSITHVDFMIGAADMDIDGILEDGTAEPVFRNGNWAF
ncbi:aminopeptidase [Metabacillus iocasae]|uniref:Aminopeptidase n=1 Tax=Priestia iocasae TaxID=2291674 RepID=A0ABS2QW41_9BACI|nr:aminopeptidase [Metabacillus iocasae]MBM7703637.1 aminopeptidase [Metabacillus iocasae]